MNIDALRVCLTDDSRYDGLCSKLIWFEVNWFSWKQEVWRGWRRRVDYRISCPVSSGYTGSAVVSSWWCLAEVIWQEGTSLASREDKYSWRDRCARCMLNYQWNAMLAPVLTRNHFFQCDLIFAVNSETRVQVKSAIHKVRLQDWVSKEHSNARWRRRGRNTSNEKETRKGERESWRANGLALQASKKVVHDDCCDVTWYRYAIGLRELLLLLLPLL